MRTRTSTRRREQLRRAKRAQRARERAKGLVQVQLKLPRPLAAKLCKAHHQAGFPAQLEKLVDTFVVRLADWPALKQLAWSMHDEYLPAREAFALYERNWKYVDRAQMDRREEEFLRHLTERFGAGIFNG